MGDNGSRTHQRTERKPLIKSTDKPGERTITMADDVSSSVDPPRDMSNDAADRPPDADIQTVVKLYQECPRFLAQFRDIAHVVDLLTTKKSADAQLLLLLVRSDTHLTPSETPLDPALLQFACATGLVEKSVSFAREVLRDAGLLYVTEFPDQRGGDVSMDCLYLARCLLMNGSADSCQFAGRLARTGYLADLVEDLRHMQHLTVEALERDRAFLLSLGTILNCCKYADTECAAAVKQLDIGPFLQPFLTKQSNGSLYVKAIVTAVLAHVMDEAELDRHPLGAELLQYFLDNIRGAVSRNRMSCVRWRCEEIVRTLWVLARACFNRRLMVAQGTLRVLLSVLDPSRRPDGGEKKQAVALISRLIDDPTNLFICQNYQELKGVLRNLGKPGSSDIADRARDLLGKLDVHCAEDLEARVRGWPHVGGLLADQSNLPSILHMGLAQWVLEQRHTLSGQRGSRTVHGEGACGQHVLPAITDLTSDPLHRTELVARGGLGVLKTVLQTGSREEKTEAARAVLGLTSAPETTAVIRTHTDLTSLLEDARQRADNPDLAQLADSILLVLHQ